MENSLIQNLKSMNPIQYQMLKEEMYKIDMENLAAQLKENSNKIELLSEKVDEVKKQNQMTLETAVNTMRVKQPQYGYMTKKAFGVQFTISIGPKIVGRLFKTIGLAQHIAETTPYRQFIPKYAKCMANETYSSFVWNYENCLNFLDKWLTENGYYEEFYSKHTEKELEAFINELYSKK